MLINQPEQHLRHSLSSWFMLAYGGGEVSITFIYWNVVSTRFRGPVGGRVSWKVEGVASSQVAAIASGWSLQKPHA